jgi:hypothetical protein
MIRQLQEGGRGRRVGWQGQRGEMVLWRGSREPRKRWGCCSQMMREGSVQLVGPYVGIVQECRRWLHMSAPCEQCRGRDWGGSFCLADYFISLFFSYSDFMIFYSCRDRDRDSRLR